MLKLEIAIGLPWIYFDNLKYLNIYFNYLILNNKNQKFNSKLKFQTLNLTGQKYEIRDNYDKNRLNILIN